MSGAKRETFHQNSTNQLIFKRSFLEEVAAPRGVEELLYSNDLSESGAQFFVHFY
jgi:hypothetical protein